jgi:hypothetical protein
MMKSVAAARARRSVRASGARPELLGEAVAHQLQEPGRHEDHRLVRDRVEGRTPRDDGLGQAVADDDLDVARQRDPLVHVVDHPLERARAADVVVRALVLGRGGAPPELEVAVVGDGRRLGRSGDGERGRGREDEGEEE